MAGGGHNANSPVSQCAAGGTGALHKIDGIMRMDNYVDILKQHLKTSVRKLKLGRKWVFQMDNDHKHTSKVVTKWLKENKVKVWSGHHKAMTSIPYKISGQN